MNPDCDYPMICWSLFYKYGKRSVKIWEFHRFSDEALLEIYPEGVDSSCRSKNSNGPTHADLDPMESISEFLEETVKRTLHYLIENSQKGPEYWL